MALSDAPRPRAPIAKVLLVLLLVGALGAYYAFGPDITWEEVQEQRRDLQEFVDDHLLLALALFFVAYFVTATLSLPIGIYLGVIAGALFGRAVGLTVVSFSSTAGAIAAFSLSRWLLRDWVERRWGARLAPLQRGVEADGAYYLLALRLSPVVPFTLINLAMGLTRLRLWTFWWVSQLGMLPISFLFVNAGVEVSRVERPQDLLSPTLVVSLSLVAIVPVALRLGWKRWFKPLVPPPGGGLGEDRSAPADR